ncbi:hypothetical protein ABIA06_004554 [Bradyrhizobium yuanmingense]|uniref:hypothetical protein n=1 Tax=Bradyrhizobium yuanmingense TaxID=108015 RepID=UPI0035151C4A
MIMMQQCRRCEQNLPLSSFGYGGRSRLRRFCHGCFSAIVNGEVFTMNPTEADTFMARLEAGQSLRMLTGGAGEPPICSAEAFRRHCELHAEWGEKARALVNSNGKSRILEGVYNRTVASRTACNRGHPLSIEVAARMHTERKWDHKWCDTCVRSWNGVGRYLAEDTTITEPPKIEARLNLSKGSVHLTPDDIALIEKWLNLGASLRKLLSEYDTIRLRLYRQRNPVWETKFKPIITRNSRLATAAGSRGYQTHCKYGHALTEDNVKVDSRNGTRACITCRRAFTGAKVTEETIKTVERGLLTGMSFTQLTTPAAGKRSVISGLQLRTLRVKRPDVNERLARAARNPITFRSMLRTGSVAQIKGLQLEPPSEFVPNSDIPLYVPQDGDYDWLYSLTPRYLQRSAREEIVGDLFLELVERRVDRASVPACARRLVAAFNKENPMKEYGDIRTPLPLDAPAYLDGTMSRVEIVSEGLWS